MPVCNSGDLLHIVEWNRCDSRIAVAKDNSRAGDIRPYLPATPASYRSVRHHRKRGIPARDAVHRAGDEGHHSWDVAIDRRAIPELEIGVQTPGPHRSIRPNGERVRRSELLCMAGRPGAERTD